MQLPGDLDRDFPVKPGCYRTNIYNNEKYEGITHIPLLLERYWDYRGFFWQGSGGRFGMMSLIIQLQQISTSFDINIIEDLSSIQQTITNRITEDYKQLNTRSEGDLPSEEKELEWDLDFVNYNLNGISILISKETTNSPSHPSEIMVFHVPVSERHYLNFRFKTTPLGNGSFAKWYPQAMRDIDTIMATLKVDYAPSVLTQP